MAFLTKLLGKGGAPAAAAVATSTTTTGAGWAAPLFSAPLAPLLADSAGRTLVWQVEDAGSAATVTEQFKGGAEEYHRRYAASDHFEHLFRQAFQFTEAKVAEAPLILDLGSGSGVNSVAPCRRIFPGASIVATDLSAELLALLADYLVAEGGAEAVACVKMDAMSEVVTPGAFDLVTGAAILHHLDRPGQGLAAAARALKPGGVALFFEPFNGWGVVRLAFERILAEALLRGDPLDPVVDGALRGLVSDLAARSRPDRGPEDVAHLDDKWLFSRTGIDVQARKAGFAKAELVPHSDHPSLYRDVAGIHLRLAAGRDDLQLPAWAYDILDAHDAAMTLHAKRDLMLEATIVLTKAG